MKAVMYMMKQTDIRSRQSNNRKGKFETIFQSLQKCLGYVGIGKHDANIFFLHFVLLGPGTQNSSKASFVEEFGLAQTSKLPYFEEFN